MCYPKQIKLNAKQKNILKNFGIDPCTVMDFREFTLRGANPAKPIAKSMGMEVIFWHACIRCGSNLRSRNGPCIICNGKSLQFQRRHSNPGYCYLAYSPSTGQCKVGISKTMARRIQNLRQHRYGGANDWEEVGRGYVENCGQVEAEVSLRMGGYQKNTKYSNDGQWHKSIEAVEIDVKTAWWHFIRILNKYGASEIRKFEEVLER